MWTNRMVRPSLFLAAALAWLPAAAQDNPPDSIDFGGGTLTITETPDGDKVLAFNGRELARNFVVFYDKTVEVGETEVALFAVGDGGNQCGPAEVLVWKDKARLIRSEIVGENDCGAPPAAVSDSSIYFVPYLVPGSSAPAQIWSPEDGLRVAGTLTYAPQPDTGWKDLNASDMDSIVDAFANAAVYGAALSLLGKDLTEFATGLLTGGGVETLASGVIYGSGCVPHACGSSDAFMAVDAKGRKVYFAQQGDGPEPRSWPKLSLWPGDVARAMGAAIDR